MKPLEEQMGVYAAYHQDRRNKLTHFVGVPVIVLSLMIPLSWVKVEPVSAAWVITGILVAYYLVMGALLWLGQFIGELGALWGWIWFGVLFVGGWILQLVGHVYEGRKPALADNLFQIFVAPIFLAAEVFFALGYKPKLHAAVQERAMRLRATA